MVMNKQIEEILKKVGAISYDDDNQKMTPMLVGEQINQFAELLIKECASIVDGFEITQEVALDEYVDYEASDVLKKHFGVE